MIYVDECSINPITNQNPVHSHTHIRDNINECRKETGYEVWTGFIWLWAGSNGGHWEHDNDPTGSTKREELPKKMDDLIFKKRATRK
jgi:hypothetical protein